MPQLLTPARLATLTGPGPLILAADYDGTLVPMARSPEAAAPPPRLVSLLLKLASLPQVHLAVVSGRPLAQLERWLPREVLYLVGTHGGEIREPQGKVVRCVAGEDWEMLGRLARRAGQLLEGRRGFLLEDKGAALALHYRLADPGEAEKVLAAFQYLAERELPDHFSFLAGKKVLEVRPRYLHKGRAVKWLLSRWPRAGAIYIGDDVTDEDAFRALAGRGLSVLVAERERPSRATYRLREPGEVEEYLTLLGDRYIKEVES